MRSGLFPKISFRVHILDCAELFLVQLFISWLPGYQAELLRFGFTLHQNWTPTFLLDNLPTQWQSSPRSPPCTCRCVLLHLSSLGFCMGNGFLDEKEVLWPEVLFNLSLDQLGFCSRPYFFPHVLCTYFMEYSLLFLCSLFHRKFCGAVVVFIG